MMKTLTEKRFFDWREDDVSVTLRNRSGSYGGGFRGARHLLYQDTIGSLCARDYKGVGSEYVEEGKLIVDYRGENELLHRKRSVRPVETEPVGGCAELYARPASNYRG